MCIVGGDLSLPYVTTLPNILRQYNPDLYGYSTGETPSEDFLDLPNTRLNVAMSGDYTSDMLGQAQELVSRMRDSDEVDFQNDWKLVTIFIGSNDVCLFCTNDSLSGDPDVWTQNVADALDYLQDNLPRTFVNLVQVSRVGDLMRSVVMSPTRGTTCQFFYSLPFLCPCGPFGPATVGERFDNLFVEFQENLEELVESGEYDTTDDFTVVLQPFLSALDVGSGVDLSFLASDCLHFSASGNRLLAVGLWNNMLERVGQKASSVSVSPLEIACPTDEEPFFFTSQNSGK